jgi:hypothetical protein
MGSAMTYGRRYSIMALLGLVTDDDDGQSATVTLSAALVALVLLFYNYFALLIGWPAWPA